MNAFLNILKNLHQKLEKDIGSELKRRFPDHARLMKLKKHRLLVKDRLHGLMLSKRRA